MVGVVVKTLYKTGNTDWFEKLIVELTLLVGICFKKEHQNKTKILSCLGNKKKPTNKVKKYLKNNIIEKK